MAAVVYPAAVWMNPCVGWLLFQEGGSRGATFSQPACFEENIGVFAGICSDNRHALGLNHNVCHL